MPAILFRCPNNGQRAQGWIADDPILLGDLSYDTVSCAACGQSHMINPKTGKVLGEDDGKARG